jgi:hypothetical protein
MLFGYFTLAVALLIEIVGAYYSITGLAAIFSGAVVPILIMGGVLELGKVTAAVWLKNNWERASSQFKLYLLPAVIMLMLITSMGIFGFLSKAHNDQNLVSGDVLGKIAIYDEKIKIQRDNIDSARRALQQMDAAVDQTMSRSQDEKGADKATAIRRGQTRERGNLQGEIARAQTEIVKLNDLRAPIAAEVRKVEAEVGPIKYIAKLIYDGDPDANILEKAVVWVIMTIVAVFDPLALVLILAAQQSIRWAQGEEPKPKPQRQSVGEWFSRARERARFWDRRVEQEKDKVEFEGVRVPGGEWIQTGPEIPVPKTTNDTDNLEPVFDRETDIPAYEPDDGPLTDKQVDQIKATAAKELPQGKVTETSELFDDDIDPAEKEARRKWKASHPNETIKQHRHLHEVGQIDELPWMHPDYYPGLEADNAPTGPTGEVRGFGTAFPETAVKGDMFLRVDQLPSALYKFNGTNWIEIDKELSDQHAYDNAYIDHLIEKISTGEYDPDLLSNAERDSIEFRLKNNPKQV